MTPYGVTCFRPSPLPNVRSFHNAEPFHDTERCCGRLCCVPTGLGYNYGRETAAGARCAPRPFVGGSRLLGVYVIRPGSRELERKEVASR